MYYVVHVQGPGKGCDIMMHGYLVCTLANQSEKRAGREARCALVRRSTFLSVSQIKFAMLGSSGRQLVDSSCAFFECVVIISKQSKSSSHLGHYISTTGPAGPLSTPNFFVNCKIEAEITGSRDSNLVANVSFFMI